MVKATKGRQKIRMEKMKNESNLQVTFSKRRTGLFKKASELSTLCGVDIAIIVFSPGGKAYSFGHPSVKAITDRFLSNNNSLQPQNHNLPNSTIQLIEARCNNTVHELNFQLTQAIKQLELEKIRGEQLKALETISGVGYPTTVEEMNPMQLQEFKLQLENLKIKMVKQAEHTSFQISNHQQLLFNNNTLSLTTTVLPLLPYHHQQQPWSSSLPIPQLQYPLLSSSSLGVGVGPSSVHHQLPLTQLSTSVANVPQHHFWGNLASSSSSMPQGQGEVDATINNDKYNTSGAVGGIMQSHNMCVMNNCSSGIGSSLGFS